MKSETKFRETEIGEIPEGWSVKELQDCVDLIIDYRGKTPKKLGGNWSNKGYRALSAKNIKQGRIVDKDSIRFVDEVLYENWMKDEIQRGDVLITSEGPLGECMLWDSDEKIVLSQRLFAIRINRAILDSAYFHCYASSKKFRYELASRATGTTVSGIRQSELIKTKVSIPPFEEQKAIAKILSDLDATIELNIQINDTLEAIGQTLFKRWFVDFEFPNNEGKPYKSSGGGMVDSELGEMPKGWFVGPLGGITDVASGRRPGNKSDRRDSHFCIPLIGASSVMGYVKESLCDERVLVIGRVGTHGIVQRTTPQSFPSDNTLIIKSKFYEYTYQILKTIHYDSLNVGTTQPLITQSSIKNLRAVIPPESILEEFERTVSLLFSKVNDNNEETETLSDIRDSLLPHLMSGRIRVKDLVSKSNG